MSIKCNVCFSVLNKPIYVSSSGHSMTSMNNVLQGKTKIYFCSQCSHINTKELPNIEEFYAKEYEINIKNEDSDQLYEIKDGKEIFRADKQAKIFTDKVILNENSKILDYGCAKGATLRKIHHARPDISPYLFDVTDKYITFWDEFVVAENYACFTPKLCWTEKFDVITSFYALEHISDLESCLREIHSMLLDKGTLYFMVPNCFDNIADFIVADHVNHFSAISLDNLLKKYCFTNIKIDEKSFNSAFVVTATKSKFIEESKLPSKNSTDSVKLEVEGMAHFWQSISERLIRLQREIIKDKSVSIYGAGFYGNYIKTYLGSQVVIHSFVDGNTQLQGQEIDQIPIIAPEDMPAEIEILLVGLNPKNAKAIIEQVNIPNLQDKTIVYL